MSGEPPTNPNSRSIEVSVEIDASVEVVWRALTDGDAVASWFAPIASAEPGEGGHLTLSWDGGSEWTSHITAWEPFRHLRLVDQLPDEAPEEGGAMSYDYHLGARDGKTLLTLVNSGLLTDPSWDDTFYMMQNGWRFFLWNLKHLVERHSGTRRKMISERPWVTGTREEVWDTIFGVEGLGMVPAEPGEAFSLRLDGGEMLEGTVVLSDRPWAFAGMVPSLEDGVLHVEMEGTGERWKMGIWLSAYGVEEKRCKEISAALGQSISRLFPEQD